MVASLAFKKRAPTLTLALAADVVLMRKVELPNSLALALLQDISLA
jgi:hypothetical protein